MDESKEEQTLDEDVIKMYLRDIKRTRLLTREDEIEIFTQYQKHKDINAFKKIVESNVRLVVSIAKKYVHSTNSLLFADLIQAGNVGLVKAIEKYDLSFDTKFGTYATW